MNIRQLLKEMQEDDDCFGYKEHKTLTLNTVYQYPIEGENISLAMKRLKEFAMENYRNGWLQALTIINDALEEQNEKENKINSQNVSTELLGSKPSVSDKT